MASQKQDDKNVRIDDEKVAACPYDTPTDDMEVGVGEEKDEKNDIFDDEKEAKCLDEEKSEGENSDSVIPTVNYAEGTDLTISVDMEEGVGKK